MSFTAPRALTLLLALTLSLVAPLRAASHPPPPPRRIAGLVLDPSSALVPGATVSLRVAGRLVSETISDPTGRFLFAGVPPGPAHLAVALPGFSTASLDVASGPTEVHVRVVLQPLAVAAQVTVLGELPGASRTVAATKTDTPARDIPQAVSIVTRDTFAAQGAQGLADLLRYVPGVTSAQGEGNRDAVVFRGNSSTADFLVNGVRDDVQYYRDLYNVERVEVVKGPNAMMFGRGGAGGVLNRVTRQAGWSPVRELSVQAGAFDSRRATVDVGQAVSRTLAGRVVAMYEDSGSYRHGVGLERYGINPTAAASIGGSALLTLGYERFHDDRTADRGIPSFEGRPVSVDPSTFFGDPAASRSRADLHSFTAALDARLGDGVRLSARSRYADYDKFYQNVYPAGVAAGGRSAVISAYNNATTRRNIFTQADLTGSIDAGGTRHSLLAGVEIGRQATTNIRNTGYFDAAGRTTAMLPLEAPSAALGTVFHQSPTDADNRGVAWTRALYVQDEARLWRFLSVIAGLRYETLDVDVHDDRTAADYRSVDGLLSPRVAVIFKPTTPLSIYSSYSLSYLPRAGEQLSSLTPSNQALDPERFRNYEVGAKWAPGAGVALAAAVYRLDRQNVAVPDPANPAASILVDGQETKGFELEGSGRVAGRWDVMAGYAFQHGEITRSLSATARAGARLAQLPTHSLSLWNKVVLTRSVAAALGLVRRGAMFTSTDNSVVLPGFTRLDAAAYIALGRKLRAQVNVENLLGRRYYASAHSNSNITPGSPRAARAVLTTGF